MHAYDTDGWSDFFVADAGAAAALAGLLFVAISINLTQILAQPSLPGRAGETIVLLVNALVVASVCLVPGQSTEVLGLVLLVIALANWSTPLRVQFVNARRPDPGNEHRASRMAFTQLATLPFIVGAVSLLLEAGGGLYWIAAGMVLTFIVAAGAGWVLMIEINR